MTAEPNTFLAPELRGTSGATRELTDGLISWLVRRFRTPQKIFLVDFGSAVLGSGTRTAAGTFGYMAPESFGNSFTPKSDLQLGEKRPKNCELSSATW